jgi:hypothetical protein
MGQTGVNGGYAIAVGQNGSIYLGSATQAEGISPSSNAFQGSFADGSGDGFLVVLAP